MKLYYTPFACSLTQHILLIASKLNFDIERVDLKTKKTEHNHNFYDINPRGQVPTLVLNDGTVLTENIAIAQYIADSAPDAKLIAPVGKPERYQTLSWLSYVGTELQIAYEPLFKPNEQINKEAAMKVLQTKLNFIEARLANRQFIATDYFTIADAYLYVVLSWRKYVEHLPAYPAIDQYTQRIEAIPAVKQALEQESK